MIEVDRSEIGPQILRCFYRDIEPYIPSSKRLLKLADSSSVFAVCDVTLIQSITNEEFDILLSETNVAERCAI